MKRKAFFGGSFDPLHNGHLTIARELLDRFNLDEFVFIPAFRAPHKLRSKPTSAYDRYAMVCLATEGLPDISVSKMEIESPERPYSVETLERLKGELPGDEVYFVMGADSWRDITTWRQWEKVLSLTNHIVVTRPGVEIGFTHVTDEIRERVVDLRGTVGDDVATPSRAAIYLTDVVSVDISATSIRHRIRENDKTWKTDVPAQVANYIEKYQIYS